MSSYFIRFVTAGSSAESARGESRCLIHEARSRPTLLGAHNMKRIC